MAEKPPDVTYIRLLFASLVPSAIRQIVTT